MEDIVKYILQDMLNHVPDGERHTDWQHEVCYNVLEELFSNIVVLLNNKELYHKAQTFVKPYEPIVLHMDLKTMDKPYDASILLVDDNGVHETEITCNGI